MKKPSAGITFYKSSLCPRCMLVGRELTRLKQKYPQLRIKEIDVVVHPLQALHNGIRMIPALKAGNLELSGVFLSQEEIKDFVGRHLAEEHGST